MGWENYQSFMPCALSFLFVGTMWQRLIRQLRHGDIFLDRSVILWTRTPTSQGATHLFITMSRNFLILDCTWYIFDYFLTHTRDSIICCISHSVRWSLITRSTRLMALFKENFIVHNSHPLTQKTALSGSLASAIGSKASERESEVNLQAETRSGSKRKRKLTSVRAVSQFERSGPFLRPRRNKP